ncbi:MAG: hypothetical protein WB562_17360 [Candidatus Sulfotelmatobacter sp.]
MYKRFLYRTFGWGVILTMFATAAMTAQEEKPQITPREKPKVKKDNEPRALGLLRLNSGGKATLVPIAILVNGKFYDASAYKADPVPMALDSGTVYEAERSGDSQGLFTVDGALHSKDPGSQNPWVGSGSYLPHGSEAPTHGRKAENVPVGMETNEGPPRLTKGDKPKPAATSGESSPSTAPAADGKSDKPAGTTPPSPSSTTAGGAPASQPAQQSTPASPAKPAGQASGQTSGQTADQTAGASADQTAKQKPPSKEPAGQSPADSYRPTLRRGKPTQPLPDDDETFPKAGAPKTAAGKNTPPAASGGTVELIPAISDAGGPDPRSYKFEWRKGEESDRRQQMLALARDEFRTYINKQAKASTPAKLPAAKAAGLGRKPSGQSAQPELENVQFRTFDVWANNEPVMVLTAETSVPAPSGSATDVAERNHYTITLVARTDIYSNLHKLYLGITDKYHLDLTPRLELIDVVDADGDGRGEFLFHETTDAGSGYVVYRPTADTLWKMFDSLHPE